MKTRRALALALSGAAHTLLAGALLLVLTRWSAPATPVAIDLVEWLKVPPETSMARSIPDETARGSRMPSDPRRAGLWRADHTSGRNGTGAPGPGWTVPRPTRSSSTPASATLPAPAAAPTHPAPADPADARAEPKASIAPDAGSGARAPVTDPAPAPQAPPIGSGPAQTSAPAEVTAVSGAAGPASARDQEGPTRPGGRGTSAEAGGGAQGGGGGAGGGGAAGRGDGSAGGVGARSGAGGGAEYAEYLQAFRRRVQESLHYPLAARREGLTGAVELQVVVQPSGQVTSVRVISSSAHRMLDEAAVQSLTGMEPLPFPPELPARPLQVRVPLRFDLH